MPIFNFTLKGKIKHNLNVIKKHESTPGHWWFRTGTDQSLGSPSIILRHSKMTFVIAKYRKLVLGIEKYSFSN